MNPDSDASVATDNATIDSATLFKRYARFVASFLYRLGARGGDLDDSVQEVFLAAHGRGGYRHGAASPMTFLAPASPVAPLVASAAPASPLAPETPEPAETRPEPSDSLGELRAIAVARDAVERDPGAALGVLDKIRREYPKGYFVEERQALTVIALARAGQTAAARQQATAFLRAYPNGPFADRIRAIRGL